MPSSGADAESSEDPIAQGRAQLKLDVRAAAPTIQPIVASLLARCLQLRIGQRPARVALQHLNYVVAIGTVDHVAQLTSLQRKRGIFKRLVHHAAWEPAQITALVL